MVESVSRLCYALGTRAGRVGGREPSLGRPFFADLPRAGTVPAPSMRVGVAEPTRRQHVVGSRDLLLGVAALALFAACCPLPRVVAVTPPPCLTRLAPVPPTSEDDGEWQRYHVALEAWAAGVERACASHLLPKD